METSNTLEFKSIDYLIIGSAALLILLSWVYTGIEYSSLPDTIPTHFNAKGEADGYNGKSTLWIVCGIFTVLTIGIFYLAKTPRLHNVQLKTKTANFRSIAVLMPLIGAIQAIAVYTTIQSSKGDFEYSGWVLPIILSLTATFLILMLTINYKNKKA